MSTVYRNLTLSSDRTHIPHALDPIASLLDTTMVGGTSLAVISDSNACYYGLTPEDYVLLKSEVILEYERAIADLRRQLLHYKTLVAQLFPQREPEPDYATRPTQPIDASSVRIINSILEAELPESSVFRDFEEGEL